MRSEGKRLFLSAACVAVLLLSCDDDEQTPETSTATGSLARECTFTVAGSPVQMAQAPAWQLDGKGFLFYRSVANEDSQIFTRDRDDTTGATEKCLTCGFQGPNQVATYRPPKGDKIVFHSWNGHNVTIGGPGYGGVGSNVFIMNADGSGITNLTNGDEGEDNFHAYFSPDGERLVWTHLGCDIQNASDCRFDVRLADYVEDPSGPRLANVEIVRPPNGHFYETQWWHPDGRGFLYTESVDNALNLELFFLDLTKPEGDPARITRLTDDPAWDEQALFTPDGSRVIFMSTRGYPSSWQTWAAISALARIPADLDNLLVLPLFAGLFFSPIVPPSTDLYEIDLATRAVRRLTTDGLDGWIIPEFAWNPKLAENPDGPQELLWTESRLPDSIRLSHPDDPIGEIQQLLELLSHPPQPNLSAGALGALTETRTRIAHYSCGAP